MPRDRFGEEMGAWLGDSRRNSPDSPLLNGVGERRTFLQLPVNAFYAITKTRVHVAAIFFFLMVFLTRVYGGAEEVSLVPPLSFSIWIFALYLFDRVHDINLDYDTEKKDTFSLKTGKILLVFSVLLAFVPALILAFYHLPVWPALVLFPITFLYTVPIVQGKRIKDILILKNLYSALFIFTLPVFFVIYIYHGYGGDFIELLKNLFYLTLFVFTGEVIWDIKDIDSDRKHGVDTIPARYGLPKTRLVVLTLLLSICLYAFHFGKGVNVLVTLGFMLFILFVQKKTPVWLYHLPLFLLLFFQMKNFFGS